MGASPAIATTEATPDPRGPSARFVVLALVALAALKVVLAAALYDPGWVWLHQDDYCRTLMAWKWAQHPYLYPSDLHWLPLPFYVYGLAAWIRGGEDLHLTFTVVSQAMMILALVPIYDLGRTLFSRRVGLVTAVLYTACAWQTVMSFSALAEPLYYLLMISAACLFVRWWRGGRLAPLAGAMACLAAATLARYEAWVFVGLFDLAGVVRLASRRRAGRPVLTHAVVLLTPWIGPGLWVLANLRVLGVPLEFYGANRHAFYEANYKLTRLQRAVRYPWAFVRLSPPLTALLVLAVARWRAWGLRRATMLAAVAVAHFAILTALYINGSGPSFVDRIVLVHLFLLMPATAAALVAVCDRIRPNGRTWPAVIVALIIAWGALDARDMIVHRRHGDYILQGDEYLRLADYLRATLPHESGDAAVHGHDVSMYVRVLSGMPNRVHDVRAEDVAEVLAAHPIRMLCVPAADMGPWRVAPGIERAFRRAVAPAELTEKRLGNWRILERAAMPTSAPGGAG